MNTNKENDKYRLLLIDDEESYHDTFKVAFKQLYDIKSITKINDIKDVLDKESFDIILVDLYLRKEGNKNPEGFEIIKYVREKDSDTPVLIISKDPKIKLLKKSLKYGADDYVGKEYYKNSKLSEKINTLIEKGQKKKQQKQNLLKKFSISEVIITDFHFIQQTNWQLQNNVNILLGKNSYGKSFLLKLLAMLVHKDTDYLNNYADEHDFDYNVDVCLKVESEKHIIKFNPLKIENQLEGLPILAIGDTRFLPRHDELWINVEVSETYSRLVTDGGFFLIEEKTEEARFMGLLSVLGTRFLNEKKYRSAKQKFEHIEIFSLLTGVMKALTGYNFAFHSIVIEENSNYKIKIQTENSPEPLPIQKASRGMLSVLYIFMLIYFHLEALQVARKKNGKSVGKVVHEPSIVFIDEIDAHLHADWQQKIVHLLRRTFPNIQFVLTAHSPLIVSGCLEKEVAILRRKGIDNYYLQQYDNDFIGWSVSELLGTVYQVEETDDSYFYYDALQTNMEEMYVRFFELEEQESWTTAEELELKQLREDIYYVNKVTEKRQKTEQMQNLKRQKSLGL